MDTSRKTLLLSKLVVVALSVASLCASAEGVPRTPWGSPALNGIWDFGVATPLERPDALGDKTHYSEAEAKEFLSRGSQRLEDAIRVLDGDGFVGVELWIPSDLPMADDLRTSLIDDPPDGKIPALKSAAQARFDAANATFAAPPTKPEDRPINERCILGFSTGPPIEGFFGYNSLLQIFQTRDTVAILMEMVNDTRIIPLVDAPLLPDNVRQWKGVSRGYWDGGTLVVETRNFRPDTSFHGSGPGMFLTEKFTRLNAAQIEYQYTVDDPDTFERPWTVRYSFNRSQGPLYEYACHEANESMFGMLRAARLAESE